MSGKYVQGAAALKAKLLERRVAALSQEEQEELHLHLSAHPFAEECERCVAGQEVARQRALVAKAKIAPEEIVLRFPTGEVKIRGTLSVEQLVQPPAHAHDIFEACEPETKTRVVIEPDMTDAVTADAHHRLSQPHVAWHNPYSTTTAAVQEWLKKYHSSGG